MSGTTELLTNTAAYLSAAWRDATNPTEFLSSMSLAQADIIIQRDGQAGTVTTAYNTSASTPAIVDNGKQILSIPLTASDLDFTGYATVIVAPPAALPQRFRINVVATLSTAQLAKLGTPVTSLAADIAAVQETVDDIYLDTQAIDLSDLTAIKAKTDNLPASPAAAGDNMGLTSGAITSVQTGLATATKLLNYVRLLARKDGEVATDLATELGEINADTGTGAGTYANTADALEAIRDQGDTEWITGSGGGGDATLAKQEDILEAIEAVQSTADDIYVDTQAIDLSGLATEAKQDTILARLGAWSGSGINTVLGALTAIMSKGASKPSDITGTYDPADDSLEAIRDRGDAAWKTGTQSGSGVSSGGNVRQAFFTVYSQKREIMRADDYLLNERPLQFVDDGKWNLTPTQIDGLTAIKFTARAVTSGSAVIAVSNTDNVSDWIADNGNGDDPAKIIVPLDSEDTDVAVGDYEYDLQLTLASGAVWTVEAGNLSVRKDITYPN